MPFAATLFAAALSLATAAPGALSTSQGIAPLGTGPVPTLQSVQPATGGPDDAPSAADRLRAGAATGALLTVGLQEAAELRIAPDAPALQQIRSRGAVPLMAAGGALFIAGLLIGDDLGTLLAVGGAVMGSYGVYLYF